MPLSCPVAPQAARYDAGLITSNPSAFAHSDTRRTPLRAADRAPPRPRPPHLLVWKRNTTRETLGVLKTWAPATAMLPLCVAVVTMRLVFPGAAVLMRVDTGGIALRGGFNYTLLELK